jgi:tetratricopeptide (TPR) repeat protein
VVAMRYNVYVVTAAQYVSDLYAHLLAGRSLGEAATAARRALAADPTRQIGAVPVALQDWAVPVVYEAAPLVLLRPEKGATQRIRLTGPESKPNLVSEPGLGGLPRSPDAGFFGRDETLLALDRAFDTQPVVLLHAYAGAGKSSTAAEFARWYQVTGGLDHPEHPEWGHGAVLWSSFEHHLTADRVIGLVGDHLAGLLEVSGIAWHAITDPQQRRSIVMQVLAQVPLLWVWDNVEPVAGFPDDASSDWTRSEQDDLAGLLRDIAQQTRCKVLLTSRRDERTWLGDLPARVPLPAMPMRESAQLAASLAARHDRNLPGADWRPLLRYAAGNPLTITVLIGQALRENIITTTGIEEFIVRIRAGETRIEAADDVALGRTRSLAASLSYGFARAFTDIEQARLAVLHLFHDAVTIGSLRSMGAQDFAGEDAVAELAGLTDQEWFALLSRAADIGLLAPLVGGHFQIHPALPWFFTGLFTTAYGKPGGPVAARAARAYVKAIGGLGHFYSSVAASHGESGVLEPLRAEEANLRHALDLARAAGLWDAAAGCMQGLALLYPRTGRVSELARLVAGIAPDVTEADTGGPLPGRARQWAIVVNEQVHLAWQARDFDRASALQKALIAWHRQETSAALGAPAASLTPHQRQEIRNLASGLHNLGNILLSQRDRGCLPLYQEALTLCQRVGHRAREALVAGSLGVAFLQVPDLRDLDQAEHWQRHSLSLRPSSDGHGRANNLSSLGDIALERCRHAFGDEGTEAVRLEHLNAAVGCYQQALNLLAADDHEWHAIIEHKLGSAYTLGSRPDLALRHYQKAIQGQESRGDLYAAGVSRHAIAVLLASVGRLTKNDQMISQALHYARVSLDNFRQTGAASDAAHAEQLITDLESTAADVT